MPEVLGTAVLELRTDPSDLTRGMAKAKTTAKSGMAEMEQSAKKLGRSFKAALSVTAILLAGRALKRIAGELSEIFAVQEQAEARLRAIIKATGEAAGFTASQMFDMASSLQSVTTSGDEAIIGMQAIIATFRSIQGDVFERTTELALDLSAAMGSDLKSAALQLGKALEDPAIGLTALSRSGVTFTETQKEMIRAMVDAGDIVGAQTIILDELEAQVGGVARAMAQTSSGAIEQFKNAWGDLQEQVGGVITRLQGVAAGKWRETVERLTAWLDDHTDAILNFFLHLPEVAQLSMTLVAEIIKKIFTSEFLFLAAGAVWKAFKIQAVSALKLIGTLIKAVGTAIWEPLAFGFRTISVGIKTVWRSVISFLVDMINALIAPINSLIGGLESIVNSARNAGAAVQAFIRHPFNAERRETLLASIIAGQTQASFGGIGALAGPQFAPLAPAVPLNTAAIDAAFDAALTGVGDFLRESLDNLKNLGGDLAEPFGALFDEFLQDMGVLINQDLPASLQEGLDIGGTGDGPLAPLAPAVVEFTTSLSTGRLQFGRLYLAQNTFHDEIIATGESLNSLGKAFELSADQLKELDRFRRTAFLAEDFFSQGGPGGGIMPLQGFLQASPNAGGIDPAAMIAFTSALTTAIPQIEILGSVAGLLSLLFEGFLSVVGELVSGPLNVLIGAVIQVGKIFGAILLPLLEIWSKAFMALAGGFVWFFNNVLRHIGNILIGIFKVVQTVIFGVLDFIIGIINFVLWLINRIPGVNIPLLQNPLAPADFSTGFLKPITLGQLRDQGEEVAGVLGGDGGVGATFRQQRPIIVTVNVFDNQVFGGSLQEFGILIRDELLQIDQLGL